jgi:hypothetical protein
MADTSATSISSECSQLSLRVPAQPVDATPSNTLIRQCFPEQIVLTRAELYEKVWT